MSSLRTTRLREHAYAGGRAWVQCAMLHSRPWRWRWPDACVVRHVTARRTSDRCGRLGPHVVADVGAVNKVKLIKVIIGLVILKVRHGYVLTRRCTRHINLSHSALPVSPDCPPTARSPDVAVLGDTVRACAALGTLARWRRVNATRAPPADRCGATGFGPWHGLHADNDL